MQLTRLDSIAITGWAFGGHAQALMFSTMVHAVFGYTLAAAGLARIIEVCFIAHKDTTPSPWGEDATDVSPRETPTSSGISPLRAFRYLPPFVSWPDSPLRQVEEMEVLIQALQLLMAGGLQFMSATDEETRFVNGTGMDHVTYILIIFR